jgi:hypothetical protein
MTASRRVVAGRAGESAGGMAAPIEVQLRHEQSIVHARFVQRCDAERDMVVVFLCDVSGHAIESALSRLAGRLHSHGVSSLRLDPGESGRRDGDGDPAVRAMRFRTLLRGARGLSFEADLSPLVIPVVASDDAGARVALQGSETAFDGVVVVGEDGLDRVAVPTANAALYIDTAPHQPLCRGGALGAGPPLGRDQAYRHLAGGWPPVAGPASVALAGHILALVRRAAAADHRPRLLEDPAPERVAHWIVEDAAQRLSFRAGHAGPATSLHLLNAEWFECVVRPLPLREILGLPLDSSEEVVRAAARGRLRTLLAGLATEMAVDGSVTAWRDVLFGVDGRPGVAALEGGLRRGIGGDAASRLLPMREPGDHLLVEDDALVRQAG